ncbi:hypothetical protein BU26DRAFT_570570 [Trematosphaeria pertusa]|uniref:Copper acquisition factor BIM1-like domain-containing protein n=1 Tax=Trematosphaeria pertusa TaxID=390896 RepID=A0A6A6HYS6_9PLEO|nr:uncharacterized protein BU26DRAFT_570570 [Trematosphaeria pertusa]KAF2243176.1 hypothetical protein BU26DRAFT_570570 [Trematosphaeria pertusa]
MAPVQGDIPLACQHLVHPTDLISFATIAHAHFVLQVPTSLGFDDAKETESPCGSFSATDRSTGVTNYPIAGAPVQMLTTHTSQTGVGTFCLPQVPVNAAWAGQDAILQVIQHGPDGTLFQCAAIKFVTGGAADVPGSCVSTDITASFLGGGASSSSAPSSTPPAASSEQARIG